jgi:hypothetical protein
VSASRVASPATERQPQISLGDLPMDQFTYEKFIKKLLGSRKAEALSWLKGGSATSFRNIGELGTTEESVGFIQSLYSMGARTVLAVEIIEWELGENTGNLLVELPQDRFLRKQLFAFEKEHAASMGFDGTADEGQLYLYLKLD